MGDFVYKYRHPSQGRPKLKILSLVAIGLVSIVVASIIGLNSQGRTTSLDPVSLDSIVESRTARSDAVTNLEVDEESNEDCVEMKQLKDVVVSEDAPYDYKIEFYRLEKAGSSWRASMIVRNNEPESGIFAVEHVFLSGSEELKEKEEREIFGNDIGSFRFFAPLSFGDEVEGDYTVIPPYGVVKTQEEWVKVKSC